MAANESIKPDLTDFPTFCREVLGIELTPAQRQIYEAFLAYEQANVAIRFSDWIMRQRPNRYPVFGYWQPIPFLRRVRIFLRTGRWERDRWVHGMIGKMPGSKIEWQAP